MHCKNRYSSCSVRLWFAGYHLVYSESSIKRNNLGQKETNIIRAFARFTCSVSQRGPDHKIWCFGPFSGSPGEKMKTSELPCLAKQYNGTAEQFVLHEGHGISKPKK